MYKAGGGASMNPITSVTYNGVAMTFVNRFNPLSDQVVYAYYLAAPATGSNDIVVNYTSVDDVAVRSSSYTGASQTGIPDSFATGANTASALTASTTTVADNCWLVGLFSGDSGGTVTASTNATRRNAANNPDLLVDTNGAQTPAGSKSMRCTVSSGNVYGTILSFASCRKLSISRTELSTA
jgi:hypothetical protein